MSSATPKQSKKRLRQNTESPAVLADSEKLDLKEDIPSDGVKLTKS